VYCIATAWAGESWRESAPASPPSPAAVRLPTSPIIRFGRNPKARSSERSTRISPSKLTSATSFSSATRPGESSRSSAASCALPTQKRIILERFFDESGGMQMVLHAPFGGRINRAWGLALRKRFCRGFGFELQAAANEEAIVISLSAQHSFPLEDVFNYLHPNTVEKVLTQAVIDQPMFESR